MYNCRYSTKENNKGSSGKNWNYEFPQIPQWEKLFGGDSVVDP